MSFLDIKDPAERATLVKEYVTAMKTVKQRNMIRREMKLAIGDELRPLFHPIVNATKQAAEETRKELEPMKKKVIRYRWSFESEYRWSFETCGCTTTR